MTVTPRAGSARRRERPPVTFSWMLNMPPFARKQPVLPDRAVRCRRLGANRSTPATPRMRGVSSRGERGSSSSPGLRRQSRGPGDHRRYRRLADHQGQRTARQVSCKLGDRYYDAEIVGVIKPRPALLNRPPTCGPCSEPRSSGPSRQWVVTAGVDLDRYIGVASVARRSLRKACWACTQRRRPRREDRHGQRQERRRKSRPVGRRRRHSCRRRTVPRVSS